MNLKSRLTSLALACAVATLTACGGGGNEGNGGGDTTASTNLFSVQPASIGAQSQTLATGFATPGFANEFIAFGASCSAATGAYDVKVTDNAVVYNADSVQSSTLEAIAQYADASIQTLRAHYGISANVGFDGTKVRVCATTLNGSNGSAGFNTLYIGAQNSGTLLAQLVHHEMTHLVQTQALRCRTYQFAFERWLTEGMALHMGQQDLPTLASLGALRTSFAAVTTQTPFGDINGRSFANFELYPGYRLAFDTFLGEASKTDVDVYNFLADYGQVHGCPGTANGLPQGSNGWKVEFEQAFGVSLRTSTGSNVYGDADAFWSAAAKYTQ